VVMAFVIVAHWRLGRFGLGVVFEGVGRTQGFCLPCVASAKKFTVLIRGKPPVSAVKLPTLAAHFCRGLPLGGKTSPRSRGDTPPHGKWVCWQGQTGGPFLTAEAPEKALLHPTDEDLSVGAPGLLLSELGLANVGKESGMGRAALGEMRAGFGQAEGAVYRQPDFRRIFVLLPVVLPPANRAQGQRFRRLQRLISTAWAAITGLHANPHDWWTPILACGFT